MRLTTNHGDEVWLAYGMNVHAGGSADAMEAAVVSTVLPLKKRLGVTGPFGVALRFDRAGVKALLDDHVRRASFRALLAKHDLVPFTGNAFVAGDFHASGVKEDVYRPTWHERSRVAYSEQAQWRSPAREQTAEQAMSAGIRAQASSRL